MNQSQKQDKTHQLYRLGYNAVEIFKWFQDKNIKIGVTTIRKWKPKSLIIKQARQSHKANDEKASKHYSNHK